MASIPVITSPADNSSPGLPFDIVGTSDGVIVEARDDAGLLLPATLNPVPVSGGAYTIHVTGLTGNRGASYLTSTGQVSLPASNVTLDSGIAVTAGHAAGSGNVQSYYGSTYGSHAFGNTNVINLPSAPINVSAAGKAIFCIVHGWDNASGTGIATSCSGGGLTWSLYHSQVILSQANNSHGIAVFRAISTGVHNGLVATPVFASAPLRASTHMVVANGASAGSVGGSGVGNNAGNVTLSLTALAAGSLILGVLDSTVDYTVDTGGTLLGDAASNSSGNDAESWHLFRVNGTTAGAGSVTQGLTRTVASSAGFAGFFEIRAG